MRALNHISRIGLLVFALTFASSAQGQISVGVQGGIGVDTDETVGGILGRYAFGNIETGLTIDYGKWSWEYDGDSFGKQIAEFKEEGTVVHVYIPIAYRFPIGESGFSVAPFVQLGSATWSIDDCDGCDSESETTFDGGLEARFKMVFANASFNLLGDEKGGSKSNFRLGALFGL